MAPEMALKVRRLLTSSRLSRAVPRESVPGDEYASIESRLVWILGSPRTGSSWLLRLLVYPARVSRGPTGMAPPRERGRRGKVVAINESHVCAHLAPLPPSTDGDQRRGMRVMNESMRERSSYLFADEYEAAWRPKARELVLARLGAQADAAAAQLGLANPTVVVKEPQSHGADLLMSLLPQARLLFLQRDGREVVSSLLALFSPGGRLGKTDRAPTTQGKAARRDFILRQARRWVQRTRAVERAYGRHPEALRTRVRYEELKADPGPELGRLADWMGVARSHEEIRAAIADEETRRRPTGTGRLADARESVRDPSTWKLTDAELAMVEEVMGPTLEALGYPV